jgi:hypothetical protein
MMSKITVIVMATKGQIMTIKNRILFPVIRLFTLNLSLT